MSHVFHSLNLVWSLLFRKASHHSKCRIWFFFMGRFLGICLVGTLHVPTKVLQGVICADRLSLKAGGRGTKLDRWVAVWMWEIGEKREWAGEEVGWMYAQELPGGLALKFPRTCHSPNGFFHPKVVPAYLHQDS